MVTSESLIGCLNARIDTVLGPLLPPGNPCALLDFPFHANVGDSAIWLGEKRWLATRGIEVVYEADSFSYREAAVRALDPSIPVLIHGGGSFGDVWPIVQAGRERLFTQLADRRIVQMPQTIHFEDEGRLEKARSVINKLKDLTLLCRDRRSFEIASANFDCQSILCPDMAFVLGPQSSPVQPDADCVWLARTDKEAAMEPGDLPKGVVREDWLTETEHQMIKDRWQALRRVVKSQVSEPATMAEFARFNLDLASARLRFGLDLLARGRGVITDRLHAHVLSLLLDKPHVLVDNSYGKNSTFFDTWTSESDVAELRKPGHPIGELLDSLRQQI